MLSLDGACKSFDASGNGSCCSEGVIAIFLKKRSVAKRIYRYSHVGNSKSSLDGHKKQGICHKSVTLHAWGRFCLKAPTVWQITHLGHLCGYRDGVATGENKLCCGRRSFFKILKLSQHSAKFITHFMALLRTSEKYNVASSRRRNVRLILVKTANRMDNF